jgi:ferredoxin--NADP+ reductase
VPTGQEELIEAGLVLRSVGYRGVPLPGVPFDDRAGVIPTLGGRVLAPHDGGALPGLYASGWIKRGPSGVIGTNKPDAMETVRAMIEDSAAGRMLAPSYPSAQAALAMVLARQPDAFSFEEWRTLDAAERAAGAQAGRPREKFTSARDAREALTPDELEAA